MTNDSSSSTFITNSVELWGDRNIMTNHDLARYVVEQLGFLGCDTAPPEALVRAAAERLKGAAEPMCDCPPDCQGPDNTSKLCRAEGCR